MTLNEIAKKMCAKGKGILAADESTGTIAKRFKSINVENIEKNRLNFRQTLFSSSAMKNYIGGVILFDETIRQNSNNGTPLVDLIKQKEALPGIKVDKGLAPFENSDIEKVTQGIEDLDSRCAEYFNMGALFTKWRAVISIGNNLPSQGCIEENAKLLARYAKIVQKNNMVPIVEPEVLMDGSHSIEECYDATSRTLKSLFQNLEEENVDITGTILKPNMVTPGSECQEKIGVETVAKETLRCLHECVPVNLPAITFLSGGQSETVSTEHLDAMNKIGGFPWKLSFSYGRALQAGALKAWLGKSENVDAAQSAFSHRALMNKKAALGQWSKDLEV